MGRANVYIYKDLGEGAVRADIILDTCDGSDIDFSRQLG